MGARSARFHDLIHAALERVVQKQRLGVGERQELRQDNAGDALLRIDPEVGVVDSAPAQAARRPLAGTCADVRRNPSPHLSFPSSTNEKSMLSAGCTVFSARFFAR